jgi:uncharacterized OsmC-like protein
MGELIYRSEIRVEQAEGPLKRVWLPAEAQPVLMGVHGALGERFKLAPGSYEPHAATLDYIVASAAACMTGVFGRALEARGIATSEGRLTGEGVGDIEDDGGVPVVRRIHVRFHLEAREEDRVTAERVQALVADRCATYRSLRAAIEITHELVFSTGNKEGPSSR